MKLAVVEVLTLQKGANATNQRFIEKGQMCGHKASNIYYLALYKKRVNL